MPTSAQGYLVLADISGFTAYLAGTELDHAHEILSDLLETIISTLAPALVLAKLEGDAVFAYSPAGQTPSGQAVLELLERTYLAFRDKQTSMHRLTTCTCAACRGIPALDLKFMAHYGSYGMQNVAGSIEIIGSDVNLVHRLLKNHVVEATGWRAYGLFTAAALQQTGVQPTDWHVAPETYEHLGEVQTHSYDLHARHKALVEARRVQVTPAEAWVVGEAVCDLPPHELWDWFDNPLKRVKYTFSPGLRFDIVDRPNGRRGVGARNHCVHGKEVAMVETVLDWRPFDYFTVEQNVGPFGVMLLTTFFEPVDAQHTRVKMCANGRMPVPAFLNRLAFTLVYSYLFPMPKMPGNIARAIVADKAQAGNA